MTFKRITFTLLLLALFGSLLSAISADDHLRPRKGRSQVSSVLLEATGLDEAGLREALATGSTRAELIEANGGDIAAVSAALVAEATSAIEESAAARQAALSQDLTAWVAGETEAPKHRLPLRASAMHSALTEATGLDADQIRAALLAGSAPAQLIEANGGDATAVTEALVANASSEMEAAVARQIADLDERVAAWLNGERGTIRQRVVFGGSAAQAILEEATGLDADELRQALEAGATPTELIEANDGDASDVLDALYAQAREASDAMRQRFDAMRSLFSDMKRRFWRGPGRWAPQG